jgi:hypothetical protein
MGKLHERTVALCRDKHMKQTSITLRINRVFNFKVGGSYGYHRSLKDWARSEKCTKVQVPGYQKFTAEAFL